MKKFIILFLILLCVSFNMITLTPLAATKVFNEGFYKVSNLNLSPNVLYNIQNLSPTDGSYVLIFDGNENLQQSIRLEPKSSKYELLYLQPDYKIVIVGNGDISIS